MTAETEICTIGYESRSPDDLIAALVNNEVHILLDIRMNPISRKKGFSKKSLAGAVTNAGIEYLHLPELGNPTAIRRAATSVEDCLERYKEYMCSRWEDALARAQGAASETRVALLCFEVDHRSCHRSVVAKELQRVLPMVNVRHL